MNQYVPQELFMTYGMITGFNGYKMKIKALITLWKRPEITRICFEGVNRLKQFGVEPICIYSDKENEALVKEYGFEGYYHDNLPLGRKNNFGLKKALESEWDYFTQIGSDDLISNKLFEIYQPYFDQKELAFGVTKVHYYDINSGRAAEGVSSYPFGCARMIHRSVFTDYKVRCKVRFLESAAGKDFVTEKGKVMLLNPSAARRFVKSNLCEIIGEEEDNRQMWADDISRTLDFDSEFFLNTKGITVQRIHSDEVLVLDIKSDVNIWSFDTFDIIDNDVLINFSEKDAIRKLRQVYSDSAV